MKRYLTIGNRGGWTVKSCCMGLLSLLLCMAPVCFFTSCSSIDEDLSDCGIEYHINYELQLTTDVKTELQTQLDAQTDAKVSEALLNYLQGIFTDRAHDVNLSFYDTQGDMPNLHQEQRIMDANQASYTIYLPIHEYAHQAVANLENNAQVGLQGDKNGNTSHLTTAIGAASDTIDSQTTAIYTARTDMRVLDGVDQTFDVGLYMVNSAAALIIDPRGIEFTDIKVFTTGFATGFNVNDSTFTFSERDPIVRTQQVNTGTEQLCFCSVNFPSRDQVDGDGALWEYHVYVTLPDGSVTETILRMQEPLGAGDLKVVQCLLCPDGSVTTSDMTVGVSVTLEWKSGGNHDVNI